LSGSRFIVFAVDDFCPTQHEFDFLGREYIGFSIVVRSSMGLRFARCELVAMEDRSIFSSTNPAKKDPEKEEWPADERR